MFDRHRLADRMMLERMTALIAHRGPDDAGHEILDNVGLGHRRLSIIDTSASGHQPMSNDDESIWITYNGECYNYQALADGLRASGVRFRSGSDTEVILRLYQAKGAACLRELEGMFALAIWDKRKKTLLVARDRIGIKPLYYHADRDRLIFASEMKALLADPTLPTEMDTTAFSHYLHLLSIPDPHSIFKGVRRLQPGHYLLASASGIKEVPYWSLPIAIEPGMSYETATSEFGERFEAAVSSHMVADVPVGAFLSGGVDSSSIVAMARRSTGLPMETFSIVFPGLEEFDESPYAQAVADHCGAHHHAFNLTPDLVDTLPRIAWHADEPFAVSSAFALYFIAQVARQHVKVALSGDGGDELFGGYLWRHIDFPELPPMAEACLSRTARLINDYPFLRAVLPSRVIKKAQHLKSKDERYLNSFISFMDPELLELLQPEVGAEVVQAWSGNIVQQCLDTAPSDEQLARKLYCDMKTTLVSEMLTKADRMTMAHGLETRVPFLDHRLVEWAFTVPGRHKIRELSGKALVKSAMEPHLPHDILYRRKQGFNVPMKLWMRNELKSFVRDSLTPSRIRHRGFFRPEAIDRLLDDHFAERTDASNKIFVILMLELWQQLFVDDRMKFVEQRAAA